MSYRLYDEVEGNSSVVETLRRLSLAADKQAQES